MDVFSKAEQINFRDHFLHPEVPERVSHQVRQAPFEYQGNLQAVHQFISSIGCSQLALK